jgi:hypothetical protein
MLRGIKKIITSVVDGLRVNVDIDWGRAAQRFARLRARTTASTLPIVPMCATGVAPFVPTTLVKIAKIVQNDNYYINRYQKPNIANNIG